MKNVSRIDARVSYNSKTNNLSVSWTFPDNPFLNGNASLSHTINLSAVLPEWVSIGFSAGSAFYFGTHDILSWEFTTELSSEEGLQTGLIIGCVIGGFFAACGIVLILVYVWRKRSRGKDVKNDESSSMEREIEHGTGPKKIGRASCRERV